MQTWLGSPLLSGNDSLFSFMRRSPESGYHGGCEDNVTHSVSVSITLRNLDYASLLGNAAVLRAFKRAIKSTISRESGLGVAPHDVEVELSQDSGIVRATITQLGMTTQGVVALHSVLTNSATLLQSLATSLQKVPAIQEVSFGQIAIRNISIRQHKTRRHLHEQEDLSDCEESVAMEYPEMGSKSYHQDEIEECDGVKEWIKELAINEVLMAHAQCETGMMDRVMEAVFGALEMQEQKILARIHDEVDDKLQSFSRSCCPWQEVIDPERSPERSPTFGYPSFTEPESPRTSFKRFGNRARNAPSLEEKTPSFEGSPRSDPSPLFTLLTAQRGTKDESQNGSPKTLPTGNLTLENELVAATSGNDTDAITELQQMKLGPLQRRALNVGVTEEEVDVALERPTQQHQREALISLIASKQVPASAHMDGAEISLDLPQAESPDEAAPLALRLDVPEARTDERDENCESDSTDELHELRQAAEELQELSNAIKHKKPENGSAKDSEAASGIGILEAEQIGDFHHVSRDAQRKIVESSTPCNRTDLVELSN